MDGYIHLFSFDHYWVMLTENNLLIWNTRIEEITNDDLTSETNRQWWMNAFCDLYEKGRLHYINQVIDLPS